MAKIVLDVAIDAPQEVEEMARSWDLNAEILSESGGDEWRKATVEFSGDDIKLVRMIATQFADDLDDFLELLTTVTR